MINHKFSLENAFREILYMIDNWIIELSECQHINVSTYRLLSGSSYLKLPVELKSLKKEPINIKNNDQKCFLWCHVRQKELHEMIKNLLLVLIMMELNFLCKKKVLTRLRKKNNIWINVFCYENKLTFSIYASDQKFK